MFEIGSTVVYGTQGVCTLTGITEKKINGKIIGYYVLKPVYQENNTVFVPIDNEALTSKMRKVMSDSEISELIRDMPEEETIWIEDDLERKNRYRDIIASGDRRELVRVIKTLHFEKERRKASGKKLQLADEQLFKRAETLLYNELALVLDIRPEQVVPFLTEQINIEKKK